MDCPKLPIGTLTSYQATEGRKILVIGPFCWGEGNTGKEAYRNARRELPSLFSDKPVKFLFLSVPAAAYVDDMGNVCYRKADGEPRKLGYHETRS